MHYVLLVWEISISVLKLLSIDCGLSEQLRIFNVLHVMATAHAAKIIHSSIHLLHLLLILLELLLILFIALVVGRCLKLSLM